MKIIAVISCVVILSLMTSSCRNNHAHLKFCTQLVSDSDASEPKAVGLIANYWPHRQDQNLILHVKFLNGSAFQRSKVQQYVKEWSLASAYGTNNRHKIIFSFMPDNWAFPTEVRIWFGNGGSASVVGSDGLRVPQSEATMTFGWVDKQHSELEIQQVILHEFGHALGLVHEHQSPAGDIPWDSAAVYKYYHDTQSPPWEPAKVDENVFRKYSASETNYTAFDTSSIMLYAVPDELTKGTYSTPWNTKLSATDRDFIAKLYPYHPCELNVECCYDRRGRRVLCP
jgi:serralysin